MNACRWRLVVAKVTLAACSAYGINDATAEVALPTLGSPPAEAPLHHQAVNHGFPKGNLHTEQAERVPHPEPRVIVTVTAVRGPHAPEAVQRAARETWAHLVRCYKKHANRQRGQVVVELRISAVGTVRGAKKVNSTFSDDLSQCVARALQRKAMPVASGTSNALVEVRLAPGDEVDG